MHTKTCGRAARLEHWSTAGNWSTRKLANMRTHTNIHDGREAHGREALEEWSSRGCWSTNIHFCTLASTRTHKHTHASREAWAVVQQAAGPHTNLLTLANTHTQTHMPAGKPGMWSIRDTHGWPTHQPTHPCKHAHTQTHMPAGKPGKLSIRDTHGWPTHQLTYPCKHAHTHKHTCQQGSLGCGPAGTHMGGPGAKFEIKQPLEQVCMQECTCNCCGSALACTHVHTQAKQSIQCPP